MPSQEKKGILNPRGDAFAEPVRFTIGGTRAAMGSIVGLVLSIVLLVLAVVQGVMKIDLMNRVGSSEDYDVV